MAKCQSPKCWYCGKDLPDMEFHDNFCSTECWRYYEWISEDDFPLTDD